MRYDTPIYFQRITQGEYDRSTGNYLPETVSEDKRFASVQNTSMETAQIVYGDVRTLSRTISLQRPYTEPFDRIRLGDKLYKADNAAEHITKQTFIVSEVT